MSLSKGVPPAGSGCQPTASAAEVASSQSGIPNAALLQGERYSPNLRKWCRSRKARGYRLSVYRNAADATMGGNLYIGKLFDDGWFHGSQLNRVLCVGSKAESWAFSPSQLLLTAIPDFWERYERIGRCAIDEAHDRHFVGGKTRWQTEGDTRQCLWCGEHTQHLRRWTVEVERERWEPASVDTLPKGRDAKQGSVRSKGSPVPKADAQKVHP